MASDVTLRKATVADVPTMYAIINDAAEFGLMLPRSMSYLYENVREFHVAVTSDGETPTVIGTGALTVIWANLAEVAALAVAANARGMGIGRRLVEACLAEARSLGIRRVMSLTYEQAFFEKLGFEVVDRQSLPLKVWSECVRCPKNQACDEIAMMCTLDDVPEIDAPKPGQPAPAAYVVPVTVTLGGK